jgi:nitrogen permease regulator 2-like protein
MFNFSFVLAHPSTTDIDVTSYKSVVVKLAHLMRSLEEQSHFLSNDTSPTNSGPIFSLCEMLMEDLNNYCECMIPIDELNTLNIKLFPTLPDPPKVQPWHVPLFTVRIETLVDENWDLTMQRIIPYINGVNSVKRIAGLADADLKLTRKCVKHLVFYGCVLLLDIFSFNAIYAPTAEFNMIARDAAMQRECARYVNMKYSGAGQEEAVVLDERKGEEEIWPLTGRGQTVDGVGIVQLFANLRQGLTVREWYAMNADVLSNIDLRRFLTFGVIKGFLYRVHRYVIRTGKSLGGEDGVRMALGRSLSSEAYLTERNLKGKRKKSKAEDEGGKSAEARLVKFLDGTHCFDEICTELEITERELMDRLKSRELGEVVAICR